MCDFCVVSKYEHYQISKSEEVDENYTEGENQRNSISPFIHPYFNHKRDQNSQNILYKISDSKIEHCKLQDPNMRISNS